MSEQRFAYSGPRRIGWPAALARTAQLAALLTAVAFGHRWFQASRIDPRSRYAFDPFGLDMGVLMLFGLVLLAALGALAAYRLLAPPAEGLRAWLVLVLVPAGLLGVLFLSGLAQRPLRWLRLGGGGWVALYVVLVSGLVLGGYLAAVARLSQSGSRPRR